MAGPKYLHPAEVGTKTSYFQPSILYSNQANETKLEYIFKRPRLLTTCIYGIIFIFFGNLAGNAIQFGIYVIRIGSPDFTGDSHGGKVIGIAIAGVSACAIFNIFSRK